MLGIFIPSNSKRNPDEDNSSLILTFLHSSPHFLSRKLNFYLKLNDSYGIVRYSNSLIGCEVKSFNWSWKTILSDTTCNYNFAFMDCHSKHRTRGFHRSHIFPVSFFGVEDKHPVCALSVNIKDNKMVLLETFFFERSSFTTLLLIWNM